MFLIQGKALTSEAMLFSVCLADFGLHKSIRVVLYGNCNNRYSKHNVLVLCVVCI